MGALRHAPMTSPTASAPGRWRLVLITLVGAADEIGAASLMSPAPLYYASCGEGQSGRLMASPLAGLSPMYFVATVLFVVAYFSNSNRGLGLAALGGGLRFRPRRPLRTRRADLVVRRCVDRLNAVATALEDRALLDHERDLRNVCDDTSRAG